MGGAGVRDAEMKEVGAHWDKAHAMWWLPASWMNATVLAELGFTDVRPSLAPQVSPVKSQVLYDFQVTAVERLLAAEHGMLLCMSPGLGKTAVSIVAADLLVPQDERVVVVAPASLIRTWEREIAKWAVNPDVYHLVKDPDYVRVHEARWIIVSWDVMTRNHDIFGEGWPLWIMDESVLGKSRRAHRYKALNGGSVEKSGRVTKRYPGIRKGVERVWLLSGNPAPRYQDDLWAQLHLIWPAAFPSYWRFAERYCITEDNIWSGSKSVVGNRSGKSAVDDNQDLVLVMNQEDVHDLPEYLFEAIDVPLSGRQLKEYKHMQADFVADLGNGTELLAENEVARLIRLQQMASTFDGQSAKADALVQVIREYQGPYLVWVHWKETGAHVRDALNAAGVKAALVNGDMSTDAKDATIQGYKDGVIEALVMSIGVGKFGHTLTDTRTVFYVDKTWNADDYFQSLHRVRRIGLKHSPVVVSIRCPGTVDELVEDNLTSKLGGISRMTRANLRQLLMGLGR